MTQLYSFCFIVFIALINCSVVSGFAIIFLFLSNKNIVGVAYTLYFLTTSDCHPFNSEKLRKDSRLFPIMYFCHCSLSISSETARVSSLAASVSLLNSVTAFLISGSSDVQCGHQVAQNKSNVYSLLIPLKFN